MSENKQLYEKQSNQYNPFFPIVRLEDIIETISDKSIQWILNNYNHIYVEYSESIAITRNKVPSLLRRNGLWISYNTGKDIVTEWYKGKNVNINDYNQWTDDVNWAKFEPLADGKVTYQHLSYALKQLMGKGNSITNFPDEEDITTDGTVLSFKDREYDTNNFSGLGRVILRKNIVLDDGVYKNVLTQDMINKSNTIYEIRYDFDLNGEEITIPEGCVLDFQGGSFSNGCITAENISIKGNGVSLYNLYMNLTNTVSIDNVHLTYSNAIKDSITCFTSKRVNICNVTIDVDDNDPQAYEVDGIHIESSCNITISNCLFYRTKSNYVDSSQGAIFIKDSSNINIEGCRAFDAKAECFTVESSTYINFSNCYIENSAGSALVVNYCDNVNIVNCSAVDTAASGFSINSNNVNIVNCNIKNNKLFNAITLGHTGIPVINACVQNCIINTEKTAFGGVIGGKIIISSNIIKCVALCSFDIHEQNGEFLFNENAVSGASSDWRISLSGWNVIINDNILDNAGTGIGYLKNSVVTLHNNTFKNYTKPFINFNSTQKELNIRNNQFKDCDFSAISEGTSLIETENAVSVNITNNQAYNIVSVSRLNFYNMRVPTNVMGNIQNNYINLHAAGIVFRIYNTSENNNKIILRGNTVLCSNSNGLIYYSDGFTQWKITDNLVNGVYKGTNPDGSSQPSVYYIYNESDFDSLWSSSVAKIVKEIDNASAVTARACLDFTLGGKILGDVILNNTKIIPNGCIVTDYIKGTITGTYAKGQCLFDASLGKPKWWTGTAWVDANGANV